MKKCIAWVCLLVLAVSLVGCGSTAPGTDASAPVSTEGATQTPDTVPVSDAPVVAQGSIDCGEWILYGDGLLTIAGEGSMGFVANSDDIPWHEYREDIQQLYIQNGITSVSNFAFSGCKNIHTAKLPNTLVNVGMEAFYHCEALQEIDLPQSLRSLDLWSFAGCYSVKTLVVPGTVEELPNYAFAACKSLQTVVLQSGVTELGYDVFDECEQLQKIEFPDTVTLIDLYSFRGCEKLTDIYYTGSSEGWRAVEIKETGNEPLLAAPVHYNTHMPEEALVPETVPETVPTTVPEDTTVEITAGEVQDDIYRNAYFGFSFGLSYGWTFDTEQTLMEQNGLSGQWSQLDIVQLLSNEENSLMVMNASNSIESVNVFLQKTPAVVDVLGLESYLRFQEISMSQSSWEGTGMTLRSTATEETSFCGASVPVMRYVISYDDYGVELHGLIVLVEKNGYMATITVSALSESSAYSILAGFTSDQTDSGSADRTAQTGNNADADLAQYQLEALPGTLRVSHDYYVYSAHSGYTDEMCKAQGTDKATVDTYLLLSGNDMIIVPINTTFGNGTFRIDIRVKSEKDYGVDNLKHLDDATFKQIADVLVLGFSVNGETVNYTVHENDTAKYIVFDWTAVEPERRYATIINGKMVYFSAQADGDPISAEQDAQLRAILDTLQYS